MHNNTYTAVVSHMSGIPTTWVAPLLASVHIFNLHVFWFSISIELE
jgi:hypothetical protein